MHQSENIKWHARGKKYAQYHKILSVRRRPGKFPIPSKFLTVLGFNDTSTLWVILCRLPEIGRKEIAEMVEEIKERDREERGTGMKVKKQKN